MKKPPQVYHWSRIPKVDAIGINHCSRMSKIDTIGAEEVNKKIYYFPINFR